MNMTMVHLHVSPYKNAQVRHVFVDANLSAICYIGLPKDQFLRSLSGIKNALQSLVDVVRQNSEYKGLNMNVKKTKTMVVCPDMTPDVRIVANGQVLEQVKKFKYFGQ